MLQGVVTVKTLHFITHVAPNITENVKRDADAVQAATCSRHHSRQSAGTAALPQSRFIDICARKVVLLSEDVDWSPAIVQL